MDGVFLQDDAAAVFLLLLVDLLLVGVGVGAGLRRLVRKFLRTFVRLFRRLGFSDSGGCGDKLGRLALEALVDAVVVVVDVRRRRVLVAKVLDAVVAFRRRNWKIWE